MRRLLLIMLVIGLFCISVNAEILSVDISSGNQIGEVFVVRVSGEGDYLADGENNVLAGPFEYISDYSGFPYAMGFDGSMTLFDTDGSVIAAVGSGGEITYPANGIYCVAPQGDKGEYIYYSYATGEEILRTDKLWMYYLEQQPYRMFIEKDGMWAVINNRGEYLTDFVYDDVIKRFNPDYDPYPKSYAIVVVDGDEKFIDRDFNEINLENYNGDRFVTQFYHIKNGTENFKEYYVIESGDFSGIYDNGEKRFLIPYQNHLKFMEMNDSGIIAEKNGLFGMIDFYGNTVAPFEYQAISFSTDNKFAFYRKSETSGYFDVLRKCEISDIAGIVVEPGIMLNVYTDYSQGYKNYCGEIINFAGHNLTGDIYPGVGYENGKFYVAERYTDNPDIPVFVDRSFAVIKLNGKYLPFDGCIRDSRTLVPMREIIEELGGTVLWNPDTMTATAIIDGNEISMTVGVSDMLINGSKVGIDVPAQLINEKTMLPVRALCEPLGAKVEWDDGIRCVYITK